jgi:hypothetical protein
MRTPSIVKVFIFSARKRERLKENPSLHAQGPSQLMGIKTSLFVIFAKALIFLPLTRIIIAHNLKFIIKNSTNAHKKIFLARERWKFYAFFTAPKYLSVAGFRIGLM